MRLPSLPEGTRLEGPAYRIETDRLVIRCWNPIDAPLLKTAIDANLEHLRPWLPWAAGEPESLESKIAAVRKFRSRFDAGKDFFFGIFDAGETEVLGGTGLHPSVGAGALEIGYWVRRDMVGKGLATEATAALTRVAIEIHGVDRVEIHCDPNNLRSRAIPERLGYLWEGTLRRRSHLPGKLLRDSMIWSIFESQYRRSPAAEVPIRAFDALDRQLL